MVLLVTDGTKWIKETKRERKILFHFAFPTNIKESSTIVLSTVDFAQTPFVGRQYDSAGDRWQMAQSGSKKQKERKILFHFAFPTNIKESSTIVLSTVDFAQTPFVGRQRFC